MNLKLLWSLIGLGGALSAWQFHPVDYRAHPPQIVIIDAARDTLNAAYAAYDSAAVTVTATPFIEHGFCARSWTSYRTGWYTTIVRIKSVVRSETNASPVSVTIPCLQSRTTGSGIIFHTHPPQSCDIQGQWQGWSNCVPKADTAVACRPSQLDYADTLTHRGVPARFIVCGHDRFVFYHATDAL